MHQRMAGNPNSSECVSAADTLELLAGRPCIEPTYDALRLKITDANPRTSRRWCENQPRLRRLRVVSIDARGRFACIPDLVQMGSVRAHGLPALRRGITCNDRLSIGVVPRDDSPAESGTSFLQHAVNSPFALNDLSRPSSAYRSALALRLADLAVRVQRPTLRVQAHVPVFADLAENLSPLVSPHEGTELPVPYSRHPVVIQVVRVAGVFRFPAVR